MIAFVMTFLKNRKFICIFGGIIAIPPCNLFRINMKANYFLFLLGGMLIVNVAVSSQDQPAVPLESITEAEMRDHIFFLASDYMAGRVATSPEYEIAAQYAASQFAAAGLKPLESEKGNMDGYFEEVPFKKVILDTAATWILHKEDGDREFQHNKDYKILEGRYLPEAPLEVVFAGYGIHEPDYGWDDFENIDVEGKLVVMMTGAPTKKGEPVLPDSIHQQYASMMGLQKKAMPLIQQRPAAIVLALDQTTKAILNFKMIPSQLKSEMYQYQGKSTAGDDLRIPMIYMVSDELMEALFEGQKTGPSRIEDKGLGKYKTFQLKDLSVDTRFQVLSGTDLMLKNVVAVVPGTDPELSREYITVGAHLDHVTHPSGQVANGADDNASGSAGVLEVAEAVALNPPRRSVVFITYTAEEMGLQGSHFFVNKGPLDTEAIKFNVNLDMIGRTTKENEKTGSHYVLGNIRYQEKLVPFIEGINDTTLHIPLIFDFGHQYSGSSDHASYSDRGIPSFFFFSGSHEDLHQPGDDPEKIEYDKATKISRLAYLITMDLANMDEVPDFLE